MKMYTIHISRIFKYSNMTPYLIIYEIYIINTDNTL